MTESKASWTRLEELFHVAVGMPEAERTAWAQTTCAGEPALLQDLLAMLASSVAVDQLVEAGVPGLGVGKQLPAAVDDPLLGREVGAFRLERMLGRGGMGVVYLGRRVSGGFQQSVAVKLVARHLGQGPAIEQFRSERDVLARMRHKNIAQLIDAGVTAEGMPFVVMEYIEGRGLDEVMGDAEVSLEVKLGLMLQLCEAVAYVHRNLILHRDLKPNNAMVNGEGTLKLLDFGTVKLLGPTAPESSEMTEAGMRPMTLRYASPEHIAGESVTTATDVYSLGMVLYRLVAGKLPPAVEANSLAEYVQGLRDRRVEAPCSLAAREPVNGRDLDAIVMKAIRFEPEQRYTGADALAADLALYLARRPVAARRGKLRYVAARFLQRNRRASFAAGVAAVVLAGALGIMLHEAGINLRQRQLAAAGIDKERDLVHLLLFRYFELLRETPGSTDAQRRAATFAVGSLDDLTRTIHDPALQLESVLAYRKMGLLLGSPYEANLGEAPLAVKVLEHAIPLAAELEREDRNNLQYRVATIGVETALAQAYFALKEPDQSLAHLLPMVGKARAAADDPRRDSRTLIQCAALFKTLADAYGQNGNAATEDLDKEVQALKESSSLYQRDNDTRGYVIVQTTLGNVLQDVDVDRSMAVYQEAMATIAALPADQRAGVGMTRANAALATRLGGLYLDLGRRQEGEGLLLPERRRSQESAAADPIDTRARDDLIVVDVQMLDDSRNIKEFPFTDGLLEEYLQTTKLLVREHPENYEWRFGLADALLRHAGLARRRGDAEAARRDAEEGLKEMVALAKEPDADGDTLRLACDALLAQKGDARLATSFAERAVEGSHPPTADQLARLAEAQRAVGLPAAAATAQAALGLLKAHPRSLDNGEVLGRVKRLLK